MFKKKKNSIDKDFEDLSKYSLQELFEKGANFVEEAINETHDAVKALLDGDRDKFIKCKDKVKEIEDNSDDVHDYIIQRLFGGEALVFSRSDRLYIANEMDDIVDRAQDVVLDAYSLEPENIPNQLVVRIVGVTNNLKTLGSLMKEAIKTIFVDFNATLPIIKNIEKIKSESHSEHQEFYRKLYQVEVSHIEMHYYDKLISAIYRTIFTANKFADGLRRLIFKYRL